MFYLLYGKDTFRSREKLNELLVFFREKISDLGIFRIKKDDFNPSGIEEFLKSQSLFEKKQAIVCENILENKEAREFILKNIEKFSSSRNVFVFCEEEVEDENLNILKEHAEKSQEFKPLSGAKLREWMEKRAGKIPVSVQGEIVGTCGSDLWRLKQEIEKYQLCGALKKPAQKQKISPFAVCDGLVERNGKRAWLAFRQALLAGQDAEEIFYRIFWQIKSLLLVKKLSGAGVKDLKKESGLHSFVVQKALYALPKFTEEELINQSFELVKIYHGARKGEEEFEIGLEKFLVK